MNTFAISVFTNFISNRLERPYNNIIAKLKLLRVKHILRQEIKDKIVSKHKNEIYYNALDKFLEQSNYAENIIGKSHYSETSIDLSFSKYIEMMAQSFVEKNPKFTIYKSQILSILTRIMHIVFNTINDYSGDETARLVVNNLNYKLTRLEDKIAEIKNVIDSHICNINSPAITEEGIKAYKTTLSQYFFNKEQYIPRNIFTENDTPNSSLEELRNHKRILLLGNPGSGKTIEAVNLLEEICVSSDFANNIPIYIRLVEYGIKYNSIIEAVCNKLLPFCGEIPYKNIVELFKQEKIVLILDGIDEITSVENRINFYADLNETLNFMPAYCFITSRINQYHGDINNIKQYKIEDISQGDILQKLRDNNIYFEIPNIYYELFKTPLFLEIGIKVLSSQKKATHNKSTLFKEYIYQLCIDREENKGIVNKDINFYEILSLIGKLAFETFEKSNISFEDFDKFFYENKSGYSKVNICDIFRIDIFRIEDGIWFLHKQFKEYFAAFHLVKNYPFSKNSTLYSELFKKESWQETLVFASGIIEDIEEQNLFLDALLKENLKTYVDCVKYKNDLSQSLNNLSSSEYAQYYLKTLFDSYKAIIENYFQNIDFVFEPAKSGNIATLNGKKRCIVGNFSEDYKWLNYWFDWLDESEDDVKIIKENQFVEQHKDMEHRAVMENRNATSHGVNLELSDLTGDSARTLAIQVVRYDLINSIEKYNLLDSDYIICEKLHCAIQNDKSLKNKSIAELFEWSENYIAEVYSKLRTETEDLVSIHYGDIDILNINYMAKKLYKKGITFETHLLPQPDRTIERGCWIWDLYSKEQKIERVKKFFYWREMSYIEMLKENFPKMFKYFKLAKDFPYKYKINLVFKNSEDNVRSEPSIQYYHVSTKTATDIEPEITVGDRDSREFDEIISEIQESYLINNKEPNKLGFSSTLFGMVLHERTTGKDLPLTCCVYKDLKGDIDDLLGKE